MSLARTTLHLHVDGHPVAAISTHNSCVAERAEFRAQCEANAARLALCWNAHDAMVGAIQFALDNIYMPEANCSCHLNPPCNDCVDHHATREALATLRAALSLAQGKN